MADIEERFASNGDDGSLIERERLRRASVKRESRPRPTENRVANLRPLRFRWYFNNDNARFVAGCILKRDVKITIGGGVYVDDALAQAEESVTVSGRASG
jgi:hypothetical protein